MTPEGRVKASVKKVLDSFGVYYFMPVQMGLGAAGLDFHCVIAKHFMVDKYVEIVPLAFFIETKKPGGKPTDRQEEFAKARREHQGAVTFVIDGNTDELVEWLAGIKNSNERLRALYNPAGNRDD